MASAHHTLGDLHGTGRIGSVWCLRLRRREGGQVQGK